MELLRGKKNRLSLRQLQNLDPNPARPKKALVSLERDRLLVRQANWYAVPAR